MLESSQECRENFQSAARCFDTDSLVLSCAIHTDLGTPRTSINELWLYCRVPRLAALGRCITVQDAVLYPPPLLLVRQGRVGCSGT